MIYTLITFEGDAYEVEARKASLTNDGICTLIRDNEEVEVIKRVHTCRPENDSY